MMIDPKYKAIVFDMDGTLVHSFIDYEKLGNVIHDTMIRLGVPESLINRYSDDRDVLRSSMNYLNDRGEEYTYETIVKAVRDSEYDIEMENIGKSVLFEGTAELLTELRTRGYLIGVLSNGHRKYVENSLKKCGILHLFDAIDAIDDHPMGEEKPDPYVMRCIEKKLGVKTSEILYLGDSMVDYQCARDSGADFIAVLSGRNSTERWNTVSENIRTLKTVAGLIE